MYNKTSFINETDYAELVGLCGICPIMRKVTILRKIMRAHNRINDLRSLLPGLYRPTGIVKNVTTDMLRSEVNSLGNPCDQS